MEPDLQLQLTRYKFHIDRVRLDLLKILIDLDYYECFCPTIIITIQKISTEIIEEKALNNAAEEINKWCKMIMKDILMKDLFDNFELEKDWRIENKERILKIENVLLREKKLKRVLNV